MNTAKTQCCVVGGGPAGMMLGLMLARAGVEVLVLEKHGDFLRDFRGDTIHPSSLTVLRELGLLDRFLALPHQKAYQMRGRFGDQEVLFADFTKLPVAAPYIALIPQWDFLDFLAREAAAYPTFRLRMKAEVTDLLTEGDRVTGVRTPDEEIHADLVVAADGRHSTVRAKAGLPIDELGVPIDVLWFRVPIAPEDPTNPAIAVHPGRIMVMFHRSSYWQCGWVIPKGAFEQIKARGLPEFRRGVADLGRFFGDRVDTITEWDQVKLLTVRVDRLTRWYRPGLLCIGDAAHAMSPIGGIGINLAIQDAVAAANALAGPLRHGTPTIEQLRSVQRRRELPTRLTQQFQVAIQNGVLGRVLTADQAMKLPLPARLLGRFPVLSALTARLIGMGVLPEHVRTRPADAA